MNGIMTSDYLVAKLQVGGDVLLVCVLLVWGSVQAEGGDILPAEWGEFIPWLMHRREVCRWG